MGLMDRIMEEASSTMASVNDGQSEPARSPKASKQKPYVVLQVTLKEKFIGTGSGNLTELENVINRQAAKGYRLHTITTASAHSSGFAGGDRIQATLVFERVDVA